MGNKQKVYNFDLLLRFVFEGAQVILVTANCTASVTELQLQMWELVVYLHTILEIFYSGYTTGNIINPLTTYSNVYSQSSD
jgi:hypothetical protein